MKVGDKVYIVEVYKDESWISGYGYKTLKKAYLLKGTGCITEINPKYNRLIKYLFGSVVHGGEIGYDCFLTKEVFLASTNPSSAELNFPSTPIPLLGFHG